MSQDAAKLYWVRNEQGRTWGPYTAVALERLRGMISERWQLSLDGKRYQPLSAFPALAALATATRDTPPPARPALVPPPAAALPAPIAPSAVAPAAARRSDPGLAAAGAQALAPLEIKSDPPASIEVPDEGDLAEISPVRLYGLAALSSASGWLQLDSGGGTMLQISFRRGTPEHLESDDPALSLPAFLAARGVVQPQQAEAAQQLAQSSGVDLLTALFQLQLIPPADAHRLLGEQRLALLDRALLLRAGRFSFERDAPAPPGSFPLGQRWALLAQAIRRLDPGLLREHLAAQLEHPVIRSGGRTLGRAEELALTAQESRLFAAIDGVRSGSQLLAAASDPAGALRLLYLLTELGHLAFSVEATERAARKSDPGLPRAEPNPGKANPALAADAPDRGKTNPALAADAPDRGKTNPALAAATPDRGKANPTQAATVSDRGKTNPMLAAAPPDPGKASPAAARPGPPLAKPLPAAPKPAPAPAPARPAAAKTIATGPENESPAAMQKRLAALLVRLETADQFTALGLERKATAADVKKAFFQLARELHPDTVQDGNAELRELKQRLFSRVNEAAQILSDEKLRKEHEAELDGKGNVDVARIFAAEEAFQRGEIMIKARKVAEGLALIDEAISMNPDEAEFYAWRGWARFLLAKDRKAQHPVSAADCKKAIAMVERCVPAWLMLGNMAKAMGDAAEAERAFRKVLEFDPKNIEAQRELRGPVKR